MREMQWPLARGGAELLIDRQRLTAQRLGWLGQTLISGDLGAAIADLAPGAPMLGLYALAPEAAHGLRIGRASAMLVTPAPLIGRSEERPSLDRLCVDGWRDGWCATSVDDAWAAVGVSGEDASQALMQATSADLASGSALGRRHVFWTARPAREDARRLPRACRVAMARDALDLARRGVRPFLSFPTAAQQPIGNPAQEPAVIGQGWIPAFERVKELHFCV